MRRIAAAVVLLAAACAKSTTTATPSPVDTTGPPATCRATTDGPNVVEQRDFFFLPNCIDLHPGQALSVRNDGSVLHNFSVKGIDTDVQPGARKTVHVDLKAGTYTFTCKYHAGRGMTGELRIATG